MAIKLTVDVTSHPICKEGGGGAGGGFRTDRTTGPMHRQRKEISKRLCEIQSLAWRPPLSGLEIGFVEAASVHWSWGGCSNIQCTTQPRLKPIKAKVVSTPGYRRLPPVVRKGIHSGPGLNHSTVPLSPELTHLLHFIDGHHYEKMVAGVGRRKPS